MTKELCYFFYMLMYRRSLDANCSSGEAPRDETGKTASLNFRIYKKMAVFDITVDHVRIIPTDPKK